MNCRNSVAMEFRNPFLSPHHRPLFPSEKGVAVARRKCFCKPGSVQGLLPCPAIYLGTDSRLPSIDLPVPTSLRNPDEPPGIRNLFDLSAHKVYHAPPVTSRPVVSYTTFSPLPHIAAWRYILCGTVCSPHLFRLDPFLLGSMVLYAARTFLRIRRHSGKAKHFRPKGRIN